MRFEHAANAGFIERFYPKAKMIEISPFNARRRAAGSPQLAVDRHEVNQGSAGPQLDQTNRILSALDGASKHITVKVEHSVQIGDTQDQMINIANANHAPILIEKPPHAKSDTPPQSIGIRLGCMPVNRQFFGNWTP